MPSSAQLTQLQDPTLVDLVDSLVAAVDINRVAELDRLRDALEPFGASTLFSDELRLNGTTDPCTGMCVCEGWL